MGLTNPDVMTLGSGLQLSNCYMSFTPGPVQFPFQPSPLTFSWTTDAAGVKHFMANGTLFTYVSRDSKTNGLVPVQQEQISIPADYSAPGVFSVFYAELQAKYANGVQHT